MAALERTNQAAIFQGTPRRCTKRQPALVAALCSAPCTRRNRARTHQAPPTLLSQSYSHRSTPMKRCSTQFGNAPAQAHHAHRHTRTFQLQLFHDGGRQDIQQCLHPSCSQCGIVCIPHHVERMPHKENKEQMAMQQPARHNHSIVSATTQTQRCSTRVALCAKQGKPLRHTRGHTITTINVLMQSSCLSFVAPRRADAMATASSGASSQPGRKTKQAERTTGQR